jgi:LCP family protein required for cell wall assembly
MLFLVPAAIAWAAVLVALAAGWRATFSLLVQPPALYTVLGLHAVLAVIHVVAVIDAFSLARRTTPRRSAGRVAAAALVLALVATVAVHAGPASYGWSLASLLPRFVDSGAAIPTPSWLLSPSPPTATPGVAPTAPPTPTAQPTPTSTPTPSPTPTSFTGPAWAADGRLDVLLLGSDAGPGRFSARPDAVLLVSVDIGSGRVALFGFPRYMNNIPVPPEAAHMFKDGRYPGYLNALYVAAQNNPRRYPFNDEVGWGLMTGVVQEMAGVPIDGYMVIDLFGFERMIDELGGVWIDVPPPGVTDDNYGLGDRRVVRMSLTEGCQQLDGRRTLFFSRSRHQDSDIHRLQRQLITLQSLRRTHDPLGLLARVPQIVAAGGDAFHTSFAPTDLPLLAEVAAATDGEHVARVVFAAPEYPRDLRGDTVERMRAKVRGIFDEPLPEADLGECPPG